MTEYLYETYNGSSENMLEDAAYYCYTIKDLDTGKYYSGSRGVEGRKEHDLLTGYFTSSTTVDFKEKLKQYPEKFSFSIEYFLTRQLAFMAEKALHEKHTVGKNPMFINSMSAGGSNCGAGTVLCRDNTGKTYRVTVEEFATGKHCHVSKGMMNIRTEEGVKKISVQDYDPRIHTTEFSDYILALDTKTGITCRIPRDAFEGDARYVGITKGKVVAINTITNERVVITKEEFDKNRSKYAGHTRGLISVIDNVTGEKKMILKKEYDKTKFSHFNKGKITLYSIRDRKNVKISKEEYMQDKDNYANMSTKVFYVVSGIFFKSKKELDVYYRKTRKKTILKVSQYEMAINYPEIITITKEEHENGKN
jgi:hypothetical protein